MQMLYINYRFQNLSYDDQAIMGHFLVIPCDGDVECDFFYDRKAETLDIWNSNKPVEEILPLPVAWLLYKLKKTGCLNENESKICY